MWHHSGRCFWTQGLSKDSLGIIIIRGMQAWTKQIHFHKVSQRVSNALPRINRIMFQSRWSWEFLDDCVAQMINNIKRIASIRIIQRTLGNPSWNYSKWMAYSLDEKSYHASVSMQVNTFALPFVSNIMQQWFAQPHLQLLNGPVAI